MTGGSLWDLEPLVKCFSWKCALGPVGSKADRGALAAPRQARPCPQLFRRGRAPSLLPCAPARRPGLSPPAWSRLIREWRDCAARVKRGRYRVDRGSGPAPDIRQEVGEPGRVQVSGGAKGPFLGWTGAGDRRALLAARWAPPCLGQSVSALWALLAWAGL